MRLLLPATFALLGESAAALFRTYAQQHWPTGHRRHPEDALAFGRWLRQQDRPVDANELTELALVLRRQLVAMDLVRLPTGRRALQVQWRTRAGLRRLRLFFGL